jgi:hypothetical protein
MFARAKGTFTMIGVIAIPVAIVGTLIGALFQLLPIVSHFLDLAGSNSLTGFIIAVLLTAVASALAFTLVGAAVSQTMSDIDAGRPASWRRSVGTTVGAWRPLLLGFVIAAVGVVLLGCTIVLAPVALFMLVRRVFLPQAVVLDGVDNARAALGRSVDAVHRRWWHTAVTIGTVIAGTKVISTTIGLLVLIVAKPPFWLLSLLIVALDAVLAPIGAITVTYLYGNAQARSAEPDQPDEDDDRYRRTITMSDA